MDATIAGKLVVVKGEDLVLEEDVLIEVVESADGVTEIAFNDRGERVYLKWINKELALAAKGIR